jgi:hypothetical protein
MPWVETVEGDFHARHEAEDAAEAGRVLALLDEAQTQLGKIFPERPGETSVVIHRSNSALCLAQPWLPVARRLTAPAGRRYLAGWAGLDSIHVLAPRALADRASSVEGSREVLMLTPAALYAQLVVAANNPALPPPFTLRAFRRWLRWSWLAQGAAQFFSGQTAWMRPAISVRLREGPPPSFPPSREDAAVLGGSVFDLLVREEGEAAAVRLASTLHSEGPKPALREAFRGRSIGHTKAAWLAHLARMAGSA